MAHRFCARLRCPVVRGARWERKPGLGWRRTPAFQSAGGRIRFRALSEFHRGRAPGPCTFDAMQEEDSSLVGPGGGIQQGFFALHLDPGPVAKEGDSPSAARPKEYLDDVLRLVERGDTADHKFTLMFTGQWAHHLQSSECLLPFQEGSLPGSYAYQGELVDSCTGLVHALEANGHEIALHHHPAGAPASWDGYSNTPPTGPEQLNYLGTVDDLLERVGQLSANGIPGNNELHHGGVSNWRTFHPGYLGSRTHRLCGWRESWRPGVDPLRMDRRWKSGVEAADALGQDAENR